MEINIGQIIGDIVNSETRIWSIITTLSLAALLILLAQQYGGELFNQSEDESSESDEIILSSTADNPDPIAQNCLDHSGLARHDHSNLNIYILSLIHISEPTRPY